ncbi:MAG: hypothetical protein ABR536_01870 [Solirubrobacterales bacterium]
MPPITGPVAERPPAEEPEPGEAGEPAQPETEPRDNPDPDPERIEKTEEDLDKISGN